MAQATTNSVKHSNSKKKSKSTAFVKPLEVTKSKEKECAISELLFFSNK